MGAAGLTSAPVISRLRDARDHEHWVADPGYSIVRDALFDQDPTQVAILGAGVHQVEGVTFGEIQDAVRRIAGVLRQRGALPGDRVAMYLDPSQEAAEVVCGVLAAGAVLLPIPKLLGGASITHRLRDVGAIVLVTDAVGLARLAETRATTTGITVLTVDSSSADDLLDQARAADGIDPSSPRPTTRAADVHLGDQRQPQGDRARQPRPPRPRRGRLRLRALPGRRRLLRHG